MTFGATERVFIAGFLPYNDYVANQTPPVDKAFLLPFMEATMTVLSTMANTKIDAKQIFIRPRDQASGDISAIVTMTSGQHHGSMAIAFDEACFLDIVKNMLGEVHTEITVDVADAAGEICNQIFGVAKQKLNQHGYSIEPARPTVITGPKHRIQHRVAAPCWAIRFESTAGSLILETTIEKI